MNQVIECWIILSAKGVSWHYLAAKGYLPLSRDEVLGILPINTISVRVERVLLHADNIKCTTQGHSCIFYPPESAFEIFPSLWKGY